MLQSLLQMVFGVGFGYQKTHLFTGYDWWFCRVNLPQQEDLIPRFADFWIPQTMVTLIPCFQRSEGQEFFGAQQKVEGRFYAIFVNLYVSLICC